MKKQSYVHWITSLILLILFIALDQLTKQFAVHVLKGSGDIILIPGVLQLHYLENTGAAFSLLEGHLSVFYITTPLLLILLVYLLLRTPCKRPYLSLRIVYLFLIAGALGNFIDRLAYHYVIDFIYFSLIDFPVFNVADIYVTCSVAVLFYLILFRFKDLDELWELYLPGQKKER